VTVRGLFLTGRAVDEMIKTRAAAAKMVIIDGLKAPPTAFGRARTPIWPRPLVPLAERNTASDWSAESTLADEIYNRPDGTLDSSKDDPPDAAPLWGDFTAQTMPR
jgi:hypothetical protein